MDRTPTLPLATGASILGAALLVGWGLSLPFQVDVGEKTLSGLEWEEPSAAVSSVTGRPRTAPDSAPAAGPLTLRMVDAGGVGIPANTASWGSTYSHATHAFDQLVLPGPLDATLSEPPADDPPAPEGALVLPPIAPVSTQNPLRHSRGGSQPPPSVHSHPSEPTPHSSVA